MTHGQFQAVDQMEDASWFLGAVSIMGTYLSRVRKKALSLEPTCVRPDQIQNPDSKVKEMMRSQNKILMINIYESSGNLKIEFHNELKKSSLQLISQ